MPPPPNIEDKIIGPGGGTQPLERGAARTYLRQEVASSVLVEVRGQNHVPCARRTPLQRNPPQKSLFRGTRFRGTRFRGTRFRGTGTGGERLYLLASPLYTALQNTSEAARDMKRPPNSTSEKVCSKGKGSNVRYFGSTE